MMTWRSWIAKEFGPGFFAGVTFANWLRMLKANRFAIHPRYWLRAAVTTQYSLMNSIVARRERRKFGTEVEQTVVQPPVFVLGHWRSGTTHLHNFLSRDDRFAFPNLFQATFPHTFLSAEGGGNHKLMRFFMPRNRLMDAMHLDLSVPWEDEYATCVASSISPYMDGAFPKRLEHYERYMTFRDVPESDVARWQASLMLLLKKLTYKYRRPLILKSPPHMCRIRLLLQMFPDAKFVHIRRNPIDVFRSTQHMTNMMLQWYELQRFPREQMNDWIIQRYRQMYDIYFEERSLIPQGWFHEVSFEELQDNPIATMRTIYNELDLPDFERAKPPLRDYVASLEGYRKNVFTELPPALHAKIADRWFRAFSEWGYAVD